MLLHKKNFDVKIIKKIQFFRQSLKIVILLFQYCTAMRNFLLFFLVSTVFRLTAQDVFQTYAGNPSVSQINISSQMFNMLSKFKVNVSDPDSQEFIEMIQSLRRFRVMTTQDLNIAQDMESWVAQEFENTELESILQLTENGIGIHFGAVYGDGEAMVKRLVMYVSGLQDYLDQQDNIDINTQTPLDYILLEIKGDIDLNQIGKLTQLIDIPGGEYLDTLKN